MKYLIAVFLSISILAGSRGDLNFSFKKYVKSKQSFNNQISSLRLNLEDEFYFLEFPFKFSISSKLNNEDKENSYFYLNEFYTSIYAPFGISLDLGNQVFVWSKLEAFHPANIINSRIVDGSIEDLEMKGELSLVINSETDFGTFKFYYFPTFSKTFYPSKRSRISEGVKPVDNYYVENEGQSKKKYKNQYGLSFEKEFSSAELFIFAVNHIDRNSPVIGYSTYSSVPRIGNVPSGNLATYYHESIDLGISTTFFVGEHTLKLESVNNNYVSKEKTYLTALGLRNVFNKTTLAVGHEFSHSWGNGWDSTFFHEYQYIITDATAEELVIFQNDLFIGHQIAFNDINAKTLQFGVFYDLERSSEWLAYVTYEQRLSDQWKVKASFRGFGFNENDKNGLYILDGDDEFTFNLKRSF